MIPDPSPVDARTNPRKPAAPDWWLMASRFLKHGTTIASFAPSSKYLAQATVRGIDFDSARCVVELGAGTGPITAELIRRVRPHTRLVIVELMPEFCERLRAKFPTADIVEGDAAHLDKLLADRGIGEVDHVLSGLPLPSFPADLRDSILASSGKVLAPGGSFRQLTNMPWVYWKMYRGYFDDVRFKVVPLNLPPGGVYVCRGYREPGFRTKPR
jgi:phospholipid N-methyltransferase